VITLHDQVKTISFNFLLLGNTILIFYYKYT